MMDFFVTDLKSLHLFQKDEFNFKTRVEQMLININGDVIKAVGNSNEELLEKVSNLYLSIKQKTNTNTNYQQAILLEKI